MPTKIPAKPDGRIGEVSPIIGKAPGTPGRLHSTTGLALRVGVRKSLFTNRDESRGAQRTSIFWHHSRRGRLT
jgi:hypothetical protein